MRVFTVVSRQSQLNSELTGFSYTKSGIKFFHCIRCIEIFEAEHEVHRKKDF